MIELPRPQLPAKAASFVFSEARLGVAEWCSPKSFRIETGLAWLIERAALGDQDQNFWWVGPDFSACSSALALLKGALTPGSFNIPGRAPALVLINGAVIWFRNGENPNLLYHDNVRAAVIDNAVHVPEKSWYALRDTLANTHAPLRLISTVEGRDNWFNEVARNAEKDESPSVTYTRFTGLDAIEEGILTQSDFDYARATLPDHTFRALYLAQPYDPRIESAHKIGDPRLMTDAELAIIAGLDPAILPTLSDEILAQIARPDDSAARYHQQ